MKVDDKKIRAALGRETIWAQVKIAIQGLNDAEIARAEEIERMGARRVTLLRIFRTERYQRTHHARRGKMLKLKSEANL